MKSYQAIRSNELCMAIAVMAFVGGIDLTLLVCLMSQNLTSPATLEKETEAMVIYIWFYQV